MPLINNAGGSLTSAVLLTLLAWGVRWLRAELNRKRQEEETNKRASNQILGHFSGRLSPAALRMLVETGPYPHHVFVLRSPGTTHEGLPAELRGAMKLEESRVELVLSSPEAWAEAFQGVPFPKPHYMLVFVGDTEEEGWRAAAVAAGCGFHRSMALEGGLQHWGAAWQPPQAHLRFLGRDAVAVLLGIAGGVLHAPQAMLVDVRRGDERALYGAIKGSLHVPVDQLPSALAMPADHFMAAYRFPKPGPEDLVIFSCRTNTRSGWAAQLAKDAGLQRCLVLQQGVYGWRLDPSVKPYRGYKLQDAPPEPEPFQVELVNVEQGRNELAQLGITV